MLRQLCPVFGREDDTELVRVAASDEAGYGSLHEVSTVDLNAVLCALELTVAGDRPLRAVQVGYNRHARFFALQIRKLSAHESATAGLPPA